MLKHLRKDLEEEEEWQNADYKFIYIFGPSY